MEDIVQGDNETSNLTEFNRGKQEGIKQCLDNPKSCGIDMPNAIVSDNTSKDDCIASYSLNGQLHVPCVSVPDVFGGITIYDIKMNQQTEAFTFDLDITIKLRSG